MTVHSDNLYTLAALLKERADRSGDTVFAIFPKETIAYGALLERATGLAKGLIATGLQPGDHVAIMMPNCLHFILAHFAVQLAGGRSVLLNARFKEQELPYIAGHSDARTLITTDCIDEHVNFAQIIAATFPEINATVPGEDLTIPAAPLLRQLVIFGDTERKHALSERRLRELGEPVSGPILEKAHAGQGVEDTAVMIYTSGTTAAPKACELSHASLQRSWRIYTRAVDLSEGEKVWDPMPFFHSGGIGLMTGIMARAATILTTPHFDPDVVADLIERYQVQHLYPGFHTMAVPVLRSHHYDRDRWSRFVKTMVNTGPLGTQQWIRDKLPGFVSIMNLFGMSESSGLVTLTTPDAPEPIRLASSGKPLHGSEVRIVDPETLAELAATVPGEIHFRGAGSFRGYYKDPKATRATILPGGWIRSGDLGVFDEEGWLYYLGRIKDVLKVGGENVAAVEVESFLSGHPAVKFVQVIGKTDERMGEIPVAFIELNAEATVSEGDIIDFCKGKIANYKIPRHVIFVTQWPYSATKIQKFKLKEQLSVLESTPS
jgi:acyl-CoA synthetase (AMP-forming)/AMP-acid ligase II